MSTRLSVACLLVVGLAASSCTGDDLPSAAPDDGPGTTGSPLPTVDVPVEFVPGEWTYENNDVTVAFTWDGGTLSVENGSGAELGAPGLYVIDQSQERVDAQIAGATPIPDGGSEELMVAFPADLALDDVGLVVLLFGDQNWGALSPVVAKA